MIKLAQLEDPILKRFVRDFSAGESIFEEGYLGDSLYLIVEGTVCLFKKTTYGQRLIHTAIEGDVVGEKALVADPGFKRDTSAQAKTTVIALEADRRAVTAIQTLIPDIFLRILRMVEVRIDQSTELLDILYSKNDIDRLTKYIEFYFKYNKKLGRTLEIHIETVTSATNTDPALTEKAFKELTKKNILRHTGAGFVLMDAVALLQYGPDLRDRLAA